MAETRKRKRPRTFGKVLRLPSGRYRASYLAPDGQRRAGESTFATVADANAWLATIQADIVKGSWRPSEPSRETVGAYAKRWLALGVARDGRPLSPLPGNCTTFSGDVGSNPPSATSPSVT